MFRAVSLFILVTVVSLVKSDEYLLDSANYCKESKDIFSCGKYNLLKYIDKASTDSVLVMNTSYPVQLVRIDSTSEDEEGSFFPEARQLAPGDGEFTKFIKFMQKRADRFLRTQGITVPLPDGFKIIEEETNAVEGRGRHKKKGLISLLTLFGVFKIKVMIGLVLLGIFFIKKVILLSALILPSIIHNLKMSCKHFVPHHAGHGEEYHDDSYYGNYGNSGYSKEWERRYRAAVQSNQGALKTMTM